jgi:hypothetical protein
MKTTDEQTAKDYRNTMTGKGVLLSSMERDFLAGCQHKEAEMVDKACRFAEWYTMTNVDVLVDWYIGKYNKIPTIEERFSSPEFELWYEQNKAE